MVKTSLLWMDFSIGVKEFVRCFESYSRVIIITDQTVYNLYQSFILALEKATAKPLDILQILPGESSKSRAMKERIEDELFQKKAQKETLLIAFGGGVVSDLTGFVASTYMRGLNWMIIPTTLTGMIDAAIGGKTGINTSYGKNTLGTYHFPQRIYLDPSFLYSLPRLELENGFAESIKYGCLSHLDLLDSEKLYLSNPHQFLSTCIAIKERFIEKDPYDTNLRKHLNYGHTVGHALESAFEYRVSHGQCVAIGLQIESHINFLKGHLAQCDYSAVQTSIEKHFSSLPWKHLPESSFLYHLCQRDKKSAGQAPTISLLKNLGNIESQEKHFTTFTLEELQASMEEILYGHFYQAL